MTELARHVRIEGRVQGVWFRGWVVDEARARGLSGWVRNRRDGTVEAVFAGPEAEVCAMVALCRTGPPAADVSAVVEGKAAMPAQPGFRQVPTE
jgi:acylphosphatase